ncbi:leucine-rich repeat neuronal protein 1-like [Ruditapes philippinarum]|uniref:leucine-rich repeat neuronal protein 1-like n=1 Tax=Ruditapes philippinarum TaxID=129788 RepID=UPI00295BEEB7|nr:leucine-rich repeat neuronal protein 1-like [Ruditapes philippinarum]
MTLLLLVFIRCALCVSLDLIENTESLLTTESYLISQSNKRSCSIAFTSDNATSEEKELILGNIGNLDANEYVIVNLSKCRIEDVNSIICSVCSKSINMSINMSWNKIKSLDGIDCNCYGIMEIDLSNNEITLLTTDSLTFAKYATRIDISRNNIYNLNKHIFTEMKILHSLDLSRNAFRDLNANIFEDLVYLRKLNLSGNDIHIIESGTFIHLTNLEVLDLSCNNIHTFDIEAFKGIENLKYLNISGNKLTDPILSYLTMFRNLYSVDLGKNNFEGFVEGSLNKFHIHEIILNNLPGLKYILTGAFTNGDCVSRFDFSRNRKLIFVEELAFQNLPDNMTFDISFTNLTSFPFISNNTKVKIIETPINCSFIPVIGIFSRNNSCEDQFTHPGQNIVSQIEDQYALYIGQRLLLDCFAVGQPKPHVTWERVQTGLHGEVCSKEVIAESYFLNLEILSLNMEGKYRCVVESNGTNVFRYFHIKLKPIDIKINVLSRSSTSILVTWNKTLQKQKHVLIYRTFETSSDYVIQNLNTFGKIFVVRPLQPFTHYEICIASFSDINDKSCVRVMTLSEENKTEGIRYNHLAIAFLVISGVIFGVFILTVVYRCVDKVRLITRQNVFIVGSESRECFADVTESTFTYENQHVEHMNGQ